MLDDLVAGRKRQKQTKPATEVGIIRAIVPHLKVEINGFEYSSEFFTFYVPAVDRIKQWEDIDVIVPNHSHDDDIIHQVGRAIVEIGDLEMEPDQYERRFVVGDLVSITDRGNSFVIHTRLVPWPREKTRELYLPTHRQR